MVMSLWPRFLVHPVYNFTTLKTTSGAAHTSRSAARYLALRCGVISGVNVALHFHLRVVVRCQRQRHCFDENIIVLDRNTVQNKCQLRYI